jgi:hypothetical protein
MIKRALLAWRQLWRGLLYAGSIECKKTIDERSRQHAYLAYLEKRYRKGGMGCC